MIPVLKKLSFIKYLLGTTNCTLYALCYLILIKTQEEGINTYKL